MRRVPAKTRMERGMRDDGSADIASLAAAAADGGDSGEGGGEVGRVRTSSISNEG